MNNIISTNEDVIVEITYCLEWGFFPLASSLGAAIKNKFGITAHLKEGHNGIYEVSVNDKMIYTNQSKCGKLPETEEIFREIRKYKDPLPGEDMIQKTSEKESIIPSSKVVLTTRSWDKEEGINGWHSCEGERSVPMEDVEEVKKEWFLIKEKWVGRRLEGRRAMLDCPGLFEVCPFPMSSLSKPGQTLLGTRRYLL